MTTATITNEMLYELIKEFKADMNRRFEQVDKRFEQIDNRLEQNDRRFDRIEHQQDEDRKILMDLWQHKDNLELKLSKRLLAVTGILSGGVSFTVSVLTNALIRR